MITDQEVFDKAAKHLLQQGVPCKSPLNSCRYRFKALKCAIGALIPDDLYSKNMEGRGVEELLDNLPQLTEFLGANVYLLVSLQKSHDAHFAVNWKRHLTDVAHEFNLNTKAIEA